MTHKCALVGLGEICAGARKIAGNSRIDPEIPKLSLAAGSSRVEAGALYAADSLGLHGLRKKIENKTIFRVEWKSGKTHNGERRWAFRRSDLQEAFFVPGTHAFRVWGYGTTDPLDPRA